MMGGSFDPSTLIILIGLVAVIPFLAIMVTSYVKLVVVLGLVRNALGVQSIPPNMALNAVAIVLSLYIMQPVARAAFDAVQSQPLVLNDIRKVGDTASLAFGPFRAFLASHTSAPDRRFFVDTAKNLWSPDEAANVSDNDFAVLVPAFMTSELTQAFKLGFLLFLPFIIIDLIISNILLAMGMMMVSPMTISLPFKLFLFVAVDGWQRLIHGLVLSYARSGP